MADVNRKEYQKLYYIKRKTKKLQEEHKNLQGEQTKKHQRKEQQAKYRAQKRFERHTAKHKEFLNSLKTI